MSDMEYRIKSMTTAPVGEWEIEIVNKTFIKADRETISEPYGVMPIIGWAVVEDLRGGESSYSVEPVWISKSGLPEVRSEYMRMYVSNDEDERTSVHMEVRRTAAE